MVGRGTIDHAVRPILEKPRSEAPCTSKLIIKIANFHIDLNIYSDYCQCPVT